MTNAETATTAEHAEPVKPDAIMRLGLGFFGSKTLLSARTNTYHHPERHLQDNDNDDDDEDDEDP